MTLWSRCQTPNVYTERSRSAEHQTTLRSITVDGEEIEFSDGFGDLHTASYKSILEGKGYGLSDARPSIEIVQEIRNKKTVGKIGDYHPFI